MPPSTDFPKPYSVSWTASDADHDELIGSLFYGPNGSAPWSLLALGLKATGQHTIDLKFLESGPNQTLRLVMTDSFNESFDNLSFQHTVSHDSGAVIQR